MDINGADFQDLKLLEEVLWRREIRFDRAKMEQILASDLFEFGRSGRVYQRAETLDLFFHPFRATLPLVDFTVRLLSSDVAQATYVDIVRYDNGEERTLRSSIWSRRPLGWQLRFHQGTPIPK
jgi:hypothetical protein